MDLLTQGVLGATLAQSRAGRHEMRIATIINPLFTLPLLLMMWLALRKKRAAMA